VKLNKNYSYKILFLLGLFLYGYVNSNESFGIDLKIAVKYLLGGTLILLIDTIFRFILSLFSVLYNNSDNIMISNYQNMNLKPYLIKFILFSHMSYSILLLVSTNNLLNSISPKINLYSELSGENYLYFFLSLFLFIIPFIQSYLFNKNKDKKQKEKNESTSNKMDRK